jgi:hypothetical protein
VDAVERLLLKRLQLLTGLESHGFSRWNSDFGSGPRITPDPSLTRAHIKDAESSQFDPLPFAEGAFHTFENRLDCHFGFRFGDASFVDDFVNNVELNQCRLLPVPSQNTQTL